jgi:hypothetical protein
MFSPIAFVILVFEKEEKSVTPSAPKQPRTEMPKKVVWTSLQEDTDAADKKWLELQLQFNDKAVDAGVMEFPSFQMACGKSVKIRFNFKDGQIFVRFQKVSKMEQSGKDLVYNLDLDLIQWMEFLDYHPQLLEFIKAVEKRSGKAVHDVFGMGENDSRIQSLNYNWKQCQFELQDGIRITAKWNMKIQNCTVDVRKGVWTTDGSAPQWKPTTSGICLSARSFDYFARFLTIKVRNGIRMWTNVYRAGSDLWGSLLSTYKGTEASMEPRSYIWAPLQSVEAEELEENAVAAAAN